MQASETERKFPLRKIYNDFFLTNRAVTVPPQLPLMSFLLRTFLKVIVLPRFSVFCVSACVCDCMRHESRAKNIITQGVTLGSAARRRGRCDGVPWLARYLAETKGLWITGNKNNQRDGAHSKKSSGQQKHNMIQERCSVSTSDSSSLKKPWEVLGERRSKDRENGWNLKLFRIFLRWFLENQRGGRVSAVFG